MRVYTSQEWATITWKHGNITLTKPIDAALPPKTIYQGITPSIYRLWVKKCSPNNSPLKLSNCRNQAAGSSSSSSSTYDEL